jgi:hypothetical protein
VFTTHSPVCHVIVRDTEYTEKGRYAGEQNSETDEFSSHSSAFGAGDQCFIPAPVCGARYVGPMHLSQHRINAMDSLCDLCASSEAGGEINVSVIFHHALCAMLISHSTYSTYSSTQLLFT